MVAKIKTGQHYCPRCGSLSVEYLKGDVLKDTLVDEGWYCRGCKHTFTAQYSQHPLANPVFCQRCGSRDEHLEKCPLIASE